MSILKDIKDVGLDVFISYHPVVVRLKRESKNLHKELKPQGFSLMQCQEIIAKRHGFNNWYHFFQLIKKHYQIGLEQIPFKITTKLEKNDHFLVGYDINFGHYKWQDDSSMRTHQLIIGQDIFKDYDMFLAMQAIEKGNEVVFINGANDPQTIQSLKYHANTYRRAEHLKIIDSNSTQKFYNHFCMGSGGLTEIIISCLERDDSDLWMGKKISFLSSLIMALVYKRDTNKSILSLELIKEYLDLNKYIELSKGDLPHHIKVAMKNYLKLLPDFNLEKPTSEKTLEFHTFITGEINDCIDEILSLNILSNDISSIHIGRFLDRDKSIYIFNTEKPIHQKFLTSLIRQSLAKKLGSPIEGHPQIYKGSISLYNIFLRECYLIRGMAVMPAQARSLGISMTYSYSSLSKMREILNVECDSLIANCNTKIIGAKEYDSIDHFNVYKKEVTLNEVQWSINIKDEKIKNDYLWIMKRNDASQVSFKKDYSYLNS